MSEQHASTSGPGLPPFYRAALITTLIYLAFYVFFGNPALSHPKLFRELFTWPAVIGLVACYGWGYRALKASPGISLKVLIGFVLLFCVLALFTRPYHSTDLFGYINRGWQQWHYGANPYVTVVSKIPGWAQDPMFTDHWVNNPSPYGFLYMMLAKWLCALADWISPHHLPTAVLVFKGFNILAFLATAWLVDRAAVLMGANRALSLYLFCWNPLIIVHELVNGHNDLIMSVWIALAFWACLSRRWLWILPALLAGVLVKYAALVVMPFALVFLLRQKAWKALLLSGLLCSVFGLLIGWPYLQDWAHFNLGEIQRNAQVSHSSLHATIYDIYENLFPLFPGIADYQATVQSVLKYLLMGSYGLLFAYGLYQLARPQGGVSGEGTSPETGNHFILLPQKLIELSTLAVFLLVCVVTLKFFPWYLAMVFPLVFFLPEGHWLRRLTILLTCTHMLSLTIIGQAHVLNYLLMVILPVILFFWQNNRTRQLPSLTQPK